MSINAINSFADNVNLLVKQVNIAMDSLVQLNSTLTTQADSAIISVQSIDPITGNSSTSTFSIPSYQNVLNNLNNLQNTLDVFTKGEGVILLKDGSYRQVQVTPVATAPPQITNLSPPTTFSTLTNWFYENLMFPQLVVTFDLAGQVDNRSQRAFVRRIIFDNQTSDDTQWFITNIVNTHINLSYHDTIAFLNANGKNYFQSDEVDTLPLFENPYTGSFLITSIQTLNSQNWIFLNTLNYGVTSDGNIVNNIQLGIGDELIYNNSIFKIDQINTATNSIHLIPMVGLDMPAPGQYFKIYAEPYQHKYLNINVGYDECDILFLKGVNDDYDLMGDTWSNSIPFYTNNLTLSGTSTPLSEYYETFVFDYGRQLEGQAREKFIPAYYGIIPNVPFFNANQFSVNQINTQINAALDTTAIQNTQSQIVSTQSIISSLTATIAQQQAQLVSITNPASRADLQTKINTNINQLSQSTITYQSLVQSLATLASQNSGVSSDPMYRVRGFFNIPAPQIPADSSAATPQQIIQFETAYRYLKLDGTGVSLDTYTYTDPSTGQTVKGVFNDWQIVQSSVLEKIFNVSTGLFEWTVPSISDGDKININQVDIPIQQGEIVQFKIRSISEAGWPLNPLKSDWSTTVNIQFPSNLSGSDQVTTILNDAVSQENQITIQNTINATGITAHIADSIPNPNSGNGTYFKHQANNLAYEQNTLGSNGVITSVATSDIQTLVNKLPTLTYVTIVDVSTGGQYTSTLQKILQELIRSNLMSGLSSPFNVNNI